jgi:hypothetical protein
LSYAFSKSILKITPSRFLVCDSCMVSCKITTPYMIFLPGKKAVCVGLTTFCATLFNRLVPTFVKILKLTFNTQIGLYCWIFVASGTLGIREMIPKFRLKRFNSSRWNSEKKR